MNRILNRTTIGLDAQVEASRGNNYAPSKHTMIVEITGAPTAVTVGLHGAYSVDGATVLAQEHILTAGELTAGIAMFHVIDKPMDFVAGELITLTGGTAPTVTMRHSAGA